MLLLGPQKFANLPDLTQVLWVVIGFVSLHHPKLLRSPFLKIEVPLSPVRWRHGRRRRERRESPPVRIDPGFSNPKSSLLATRPRARAQVGELVQDISRETFLLNLP